MALELPGYQFVEKIGEGGMASVYRGVQQSLKRPVAIKVLSAPMRGHGEVREAFEKESLIIARLSHPSIVSVIDRGVSERGTPFFIMEYIDGVDLARVLRQGQLTFHRKLELVLQVARALAYAHRNGVVHRDIKPANILVDKDWHVQVVDFGIAQWSRKANTPVPMATGGASQETSSVMGTEAYMAPETKSGTAEASVQSDLYSLGVILFELLTGRLPDGSPLAPSKLASGIPKELDLLTLKCLAPKPQQRPQRAEQVCDLLLELLHGKHLDSAQVKRAEETMGKKSFVLLDVWRENREGSVYLFAERKTRKRYVIKKSLQNHRGLEAGKKLAGLEHPHIVKLHGVSKNQRAFISVADYMAGGSLQERMLRPFAMDEFLRLAEQLCQGLEFAHRQGVVHGNLRPNAVLFDEHDNVRIADFGWPTNLRHKNGVPLTAPGKDVLWYDLPDEEPTVALDVYACGMIFYRMLIGDLPRFNRGRLAQGQAFKRLPEELRVLLLAMLAQTPEERPGHMKAILQRLDGMRDAMPTQVWVAEQETAKAAEKSHQQKEMLLFLLLILLFLVLVNTGVIAIFESWPIPFGEPLREFLFSSSG